MKKLILALLILTSQLSAATYDYALSFPYAAGADSVRVRWAAQGVQFTDSVSVTSFPYYDTVSVDGAYFTRFQALWFTNPDTSVSEWIIPSVDSSDAGTYDYYLSFPVKGAFDSVKEYTLRNGTTQVGTQRVTSFPYNVAVNLSAAYFYTLRNYWFQGTDTFITETQVPPMPGGFAAEIPDPGANLCTVYGYVSGVDTAVARDALVYFSLGSKVNDTCNDVVLVNFAKSTRANRDGRFEQNLIRSSCLGGAEYNVKIMLRDGSTITHSFAVPDSTSYRLIW